MNLVQFLDRHVKIFHILGQNNYNSQLDINGNRDGGRRIWNYLPPMFLLIATTLITIVSYSFVTEFSVANRVGLPVIVVNTTAQLLTMFVAIGQSIFLSPRLTELFLQIRTIDQLGNCKLSIDLVALSRSLFYRLLLTSGAYLMAIVLTILLKQLTWSNVVMFTSLFILRALTVLVVFHMLFYIDLFDSIISAFVKYVDERATTYLTATTNAATSVSAVSIINFRDADIRDLMNEFNFIKFMHLHLWEISQTINSLFGWSLVVMCFQYFLYAVYCMYLSLILMISPYSTIAEILRNSSVRFSLGIPLDIDETN